MIGSRSLVSFQYRKIKNSKTTIMKIKQMEGNYYLAKGLREGEQQHIRLCKTRRETWTK